MQQKKGRKKEGANKGCRYKSEKKNISKQESEGKSDRIEQRGGKNYMKEDRGSEREGDQLGKETEDRK